MPTRRYDDRQVQQMVDEFYRDSFCILPGHISKEKIANWSKAFQPLLEEHIASQGSLQNRGSNRYYVTLPFAEPFADPEIFENEDVLAIVEKLAGADFRMVQLATDTPTRGSDYQELHRDAPPLFPETGIETPPFQIAVNFPLVDVTDENGPFEVARGTHMMPKAEALRQVEAGELKLEPIKLKQGDVMIRDVRHLHRGTPNRTDTPRPMVVLGYSRKWLLRPEVNIRIPRAAMGSLSERAKKMLRFNPVVASLEEKEEVEAYQSFAY
jgi:ectoine hydroxylase-related dioxygenase (phytanoyl-CoA dioxygenase family)